MVEHENHDRGVELGIVERQRLEFAAPDLGVWQIAKAAPCCLKHLAAAVHADRVRHERRKRRTRSTSAAAEIADDPARIHQCGNRLQGAPGTEQLTAEPIPLARGRRKKFLRLRPAPRQYAFQTPHVLVSARRGSDLIAQQRPEPARVRIPIAHRERVIPARPVASRRHPVGIGERLQVAAHGRLRKLQHGAEFRHRQFVTLQDEEHPAPRRVRQC